MIRSRKKTLIWVGVVLSAIFLCSHAWALSLTFVPDATSIGVGEPIDVDIFISDLGNDILIDFSLNIEFDDSILDFVSYTLGSELGNIPADAQDFSGGELPGGIINLSERTTNFSILGSQPNSFSLATVQFLGASVGISALDFNSIFLLGVDNVDVDNKLDFQGSATIQVSDSTAPVPEPATILLVGTGIIGMGLFGRKKFRKPIK